MGIANWLGLGKDLSEPIKAVGDLYTTDKARIEADKEYQDVIQKPVLAQISTNAIMAAAQSIYVSGWQPLIGWTAGFLILIYYAPQIIIMTVVWGSNCLDAGLVTPFPMKADDLLNLVWLLFGFGGYSLARRAMPRN
jgi:hypothetical protein